MERMEPTLGDFPHGPETVIVTTLGTHSATRVGPSHQIRHVKETATLGDVACPRSSRG